MGIAGVIARAKKTVQAGGLPGIVVELGDTLRSEAIPAPLRQAAARIADLLRVPEAPARTVVPLVPERPPHAIDAQMNEAHGGVCPFTGQSAASADTEQDMNAVASHVVADLVADASAAARVESTDVDTAEPADTGEAGEAADAGEGAAALEAEVPEAPRSPKARKASASVAPAKSSAGSKSVPPSKSVVPTKSSAPAAKAKAKNEKSVAAKPSPAKTSGRSSKGPTGKQSGAKKKK